MAAKKKVQSKKVVETTSIDVQKLEENPWNPNKQSEFMFEREKASIQKFGFIDPCTVRQHPKKRGWFQIIDGEHRWRAAVDLGIEVIPCTNLGKIPDADAKALTDILNNLKGEQDAVLRANLLRQILDEEDGLRAVLPYGDDELQSLLEASTFDWDSLSTENEPREDGDGSSGWVGLKVSLTPEQHKIVSRVLDRVKKKLDTKSDAEAVTAVCSAYLKRQ